MRAPDAVTYENSPAEWDLLRFAVAVLDVRDDEDAVKNVIEEHLALVHPQLHAVVLKVCMRVIVAQFYAPTARLLDEVLDEDWTEVRLGHQRMLNNRAAMREDVGSVRYPFLNPRGGGQSADPKVIRP
ncbi:hypothetical protein ABZ897_00755 [Nonomuraea sp. NPDC046802]|uniref:hypothetical protein n=1 Tax=Nonomuraea sp. NPDC046802 TaxID=3154919 RepID=UPI003402AF6D